MSARTERDNKRPKKVPRKNQYPFLLIECTMCRCTCAHTLAHTDPHPNTHTRARCAHTLWCFSVRFLLPFKTHGVVIMDTHMLVPLHIDTKWRVQAVAAALRGG